MEKLDLQIFRRLKQEVLEMINQSQEQEYSEEQVEQNIAKYREIYKVLSSHDLSDIDFEEWRGFYLMGFEELPLDFSKTKANLDFSIIGYDGDPDFTNFKSCQIKNFDFDRQRYMPEMFDEEFRRENEGRFLSDNIPQDVVDRFWNGEITLTDIKNNPELANKISEKNLDYGIRDIYKIIGREEFCKLDAEFIDKTPYCWEELLKSNPDLRTAGKVMAALYKSAREQIIAYPNNTFSRHFNHTQNELGERFKELNPDLFLSEELPKEIRESYYGHYLSLQHFSGNLQYFEGKTISQAFSGTLGGRNLIMLYGENLYQLFVEYKPIMDLLINDRDAMYFMQVPIGPITDEQRKEIMENAFARCFSEHTKIEDLSMLKMILEFTTLEKLQLNEVATKILQKCNIDDLIEVGLNIEILINNKTNITNLEQLKKLNSIMDMEDIQNLLLRNNYEMRNLINKYGIDTLIGYGIKDLSEVTEPTNDLKLIKELLEKRPIDLINMGSNTKKKLDFIKKYGIDNILALEEETNGMFSYNGSSGNEIFLYALADYDSIFSKDEDKTFTYDEFKNRMYERLKSMRKYRELSRYIHFQDFDFIQGEFRREHAEFFLDDNVSSEILNKFYNNELTAEDVRKNPELIQLLQGKDLSLAFHQRIYYEGDLPMGMTFEELEAKGVVVFWPNDSIAKVLGEKLGQEEFFKLCATYGKCLDKVNNLFVKKEDTLESLTEEIEQEIYAEIKRNGIKYFEDLPLSFKQKHPELFLPQEIDEELREKFYEGRLTYEDIRKNPQIKEILLTKDIGVGFSGEKYKPINAILLSGQKEISSLMWEKLSNKEIIYLAEKYGMYLKDVDDSCFEKDYDMEELEKVLQANIEENILNRTKKISGLSQNSNSPYKENVPEFFKEKYPEMFLDDGAPADLKSYFYDGADLSFKLIKEHPEWKEFLQGKELRRAFPENYKELFSRFDSATLMKVGTRTPETIEKMVQNHKEELLENWYKSTGGKFIPHHVVMLNYPEGEIDSFLENSKRWSQLMRIDNYNLNDDGKAAILKASYAMGVFQGNDDGFNKTMELFTGLPKVLSSTDYEKVIQTIGVDEDKKSIIEQAYKIDEDGTYGLKINSQDDKEKTKNIRNILEESNIPKILTPQKAHQIFDSFAMEYNEDFVKFFNENFEEIISDSEYIKSIATIQRQFKDIVRTNAGRRLTLGVAQDYIKSIVYEGIEVGNEGVAEQAKIAGYSQADFEAIQSLFNEGEIREFSSIPRIQGKFNGYTYEMLRCDDPLALTIGTLTDCCQAIHGAGQTSMEHSVVSPDGRVFCVKDEEGRIVAQSWFWRNQYTGCFDNIEIPNRIFELYEKQHSDKGRKGLTADVLEVYKRAAQDLMQEDERVYQELLENGTITQEQYDALLLGRVTIGMGYNDIKDAIKSDNTMHIANEQVYAKGTDRLPHPYTDAGTQYTIHERERIVKSDQENLYVHQDNVPVYDGSNMNSTVLLTMKRMEQETERYNLAYVSEKSNETNIPQSQVIINNVANRYGFEPENTKVMATSRMAIIYSKEDEKINIGDLLVSPIKKELTEEEKKRAESHIKYQVKKALKQIGVPNSEVELSSLGEEQQQMLKSVIEEIVKENDERGEK